MTAKLIVTRGLPASGKTTWARAYIARQPLGEVIRVNRDDLRTMLFGPEYATPVHDCEEQITRVQRHAVEQGLRRGQTVIVDDTNLPAKRVRGWALLAHKVGADFEIADGFVSRSLEICLLNDFKRQQRGARYVGEQVIRNMWERYIRGGIAKPDLSIPAPAVGEPYVPPTGVGPAVIIDIDGTVALHEGVRSPYDTSLYHLDKPNEKVIELVRLLDREGYELLFTSGREAAFREATTAWIDRHVLPYDARYELFMRATGDTRNDAIVKIELFDTHIRPHFDVRFVLDDRNRVVEAWRAIGLTVLQVAPGDF
jgi:predicted kinase